MYDTGVNVDNSVENGDFVVRIDILFSCQTIYPPPEWGIMLIKNRLSQKVIHNSDLKSQKMAKALKV